MLLFKVLNGPQCSSGRMRFISVCDTLDMGIDNARLSDVTLKARPAFAQVMPKARKPSHGLGGVGGETRSQIAHATKMLVKPMRILPTALWWRVSPVLTGCIRDHARV
ncbi:MAG: hypothetical protein JM57_06700 [Comamonadaceae bacterium BICA1-1]|nr:MAG: hypothetical protein JM57_06700 [Comamonadaceae bacterium BICA1-1]